MKINKNKIGEIIKNNLLSSRKLLRSKFSVASEDEQYRKDLINDFDKKCNRKTIVSRQPTKTWEAGLRLSGLEMK